MKNEMSIKQKQQMKTFILAANETEFGIYVYKKPNIPAEVEIQPVVATGRNVKREDVLLIVGEDESCSSGLVVTESAVVLYDVINDGYKILDYDKIQFIAGIETHVLFIDQENHRYELSIADWLGNEYDKLLYDFLESVKEQYLCVCNIKDAGV